jgi:hypothetical protein
MAAPGSGAHLVHEHRRDPGDDGEDQPRLTACISGKSQPWNGRSSTVHTDGGASGTGLEGRTFFLLSSRPRRHRVRPVIGRKYKLPAGSFLPFLGGGVTAGLLTSGAAPWVPGLVAAGYPRVVSRVGLP